MVYMGYVTILKIQEKKCNISLILIINIFYTVVTLVTFFMKVIYVHAFFNVIYNYTFMRAHAQAHVKNPKKSVTNVTFLPLILIVKGSACDTFF